MWILRKLALIAAIAGFVAAFVWLDNDKQFKRTIFPDFSLYNTSEKGCSLAFRYLKESRGKSAPAVKELNRMLEFAELEADAVVFRISPRKKPGERHDPDPNKSGEKLGEKKKKPEIAHRDSPLLTPAESIFVEKGGRLVLALDKNYGPIETTHQQMAEPFEKSFPLWPGVNLIRPTESRTLKGAPLNDAHTIFALNGAVYVARLAVGKGDVIAIGSSKPFTNSHLDDADNLKFLAALAPADRPAYFDEFVHDMAGSPSVFELLQRWGLGMAMLVMAAGTLVAFWRARTPVGPPEDDHKETRTQAIDFVGSLAPLYNRALEPQQALMLYYNNFVHAVSAQTGLRGEELNAKMSALLMNANTDSLTGKVPLGPQEFDYQLNALNQAYGRLERAHRR